MKKGQNYHVVPRENGWAVLGEGNLRATSVVDLKKDATQLANSICIQNQSELIVHNKDGKFAYRSSHGNDPREIKG